MTEASLAAHAAAGRALIRDKALVAGHWVAGDGAVEVDDPAERTRLGSVPRLSAAQVGEAVAQAAAAFADWSRRKPVERGRFLSAWADRVDAAEQALAALISLENGKPYAEALGEIRYANSFIRWFAGQAERMDGEVIATSAGDTVLTFKEPVGPVAAITPWNFPLAMMARKTAPALATGCTQVVKPAEATPLSALALGGVLHEAGLPRGVVNVVTGDPQAISDAWLRDGRVRGLSFTGSTAVGKDLMRRAADQVVRLSLELGGLAPLIVFEDADLDAAVEATVAGKFRCAGQTCICPNRILVARPLVQPFTRRLAERAAALPLGRGATPGTRMGPLINDAAVEKVRRHVADALARGGRLLCGGATVPIAGGCDRFFAPTVITEVNARMLCFREETFGPLAPVAAFDDEASALGIANDTPYGLASYIFTRDPSRAQRVTAQLRCGIVGVNTCLVSDATAPFGGWGWSGFGREGGRWGLDEYLSWKYSCHAAEAPHS